jgi:putative DNA primase/helicase
MQNDSVVKNQAVDVADSVEVRQLMQEVVKATAVYSRDGKPDLEKAQRRRALELGISDERIAAQWKQAKQNWHRVWLRKLAFGGAAKAEVKPKPKPQEKVEDEEGLPKDQGSPSSLEQTASSLLDGVKAQREEEKVEAEPEPDEPIERLEWATAQLASNYYPELSRKAPLDNAKLFARDMLELHAKGEGKKSGPGTYFQDGQWWHWNGAFYDRAPEQRMIDMVCEYLDKGKIKSSDEGLVRFKPTTGDVTQLITFLHSNVGLDDRVIPPRWLDERGRPDAANLLAFRNCLVDVVTGKTYDHEPWLWMQDGADFDFDPKARCPHWVKFLGELFPGDEEAQEVVEEQLGYGMTIDNQFEKAALWIGKPRSGRGTLAHIQELLVGANGHTSLNIHTWRNNENSRQGMVGKRVGIFHDMRLKPAKQFGNTSYDASGVDPQSQQLLLELISGDLTEIGRKYLDAWKGKPFIKFILISNKVPNFNDEVLVTRFNVVDFKQSFLNRENPALKRVILPAELPGIANRCLAAYRRLLRRGRFIQAASGLALLSKVKAQVSPWAAFMERYWEPDPLGEGTLIKTFRGTFRHWCMETENLELAGTSSSNLIQQIKKLPGWQWLKPFRPSNSGAQHNQPRRYRVKLKSGVALPEEIKRWTAEEGEWSEE